MADTTKKRKGRAGRVVLTVLLIVLLLAAALRYVPLPMTPDEDAFSLTMSDTPDTLRCGEKLSVSTTLRNPWYASFKGTHSSHLIYVEFIHEDDADPVYTTEAHDIYLPASGYTKYEKGIVPKTPGEYTLRVYAEFSIGEKEYKLELPERTVKVTDDTITFDQKELEKIKKTLSGHLIELGISGVWIEEMRNRVEIMVAKEDNKEGVLAFLHEQLPELDERAIIWKVGVITAT